jgi:hypothetical protein
VNAIGTHTGVAVGSTTSYTFGFLNNNDSRLKCPLQQKHPTGGDNVGPVISDIWPPQGALDSTISPVTISGVGFGNNLAKLTATAGSGISITLNSVSDNGTNASIVGSFSIPPNASVGTTYISVSVAAADGTTQPSNNYPFTITSQPTASIRINFNSPRAQGDNLAYPASITCSQSTGLHPCLNTLSPGWYWNVEVIGAVSDDASNWIVTQTIDSSRNKGYYRDSTGIHSYNQTQTIPCPPCDGPQPSFLQQNAGQQAVYYIDGPGPRYTLSAGQTVDSTTSVQNFTSKFCSKSNPSNCFSKQWYVKIVVTPGSLLDYTNSTAGLGTASTSF